MSTSVATVKHVIPKPPYSFRRNTLPPLLGVLTFLLTLIVLNFQWFFAQIQYKVNSFGGMPIVSIDTSVGATARPAEESPSLWIPKIDVRAPVIFEPSPREGSIQKALRQGVVHYPMTALPGEVGNVVIFGHSSGQPWAPGDYKFVFTLLDKLKKGDQIVVDFAGTRYVYNVRYTKVVEPYQTDVLKSIDTPTLTLITCTPVGTSAKRLVVVADQVSPKLEKQTKAVQGEETTTKHQPNTQTLPSNSPNFWQSVRDLF